MNRSMLIVAPILAALLAIDGRLTPLSARTCSAEPVMARGDFGRLEFTAKAKARASWRHKVRLSSSLGAAYSEWYQATEREERCIRSELRIYCIFSGIPCRP